MIHQFTHKFSQRISTAVTTQVVSLPVNIDVVDSIKMLDMATGDIFEIEEYSKAFNTGYVAALPLFGSYQFSVSKYFSGIKKEVFIRFHNPSKNYTHLMVNFKSKIMERDIKCEMLLS